MRSQAGAWDREEVAREKRPMNSRRGYTIIEVLTAWTLGTVLLGVAVALLTLMIRTRSTWQRQVADNVATLRLVDQFRRDVHQASDFQPIEREKGNPPGQGWRLSLPQDRVVEYRRGAARLERAERVSGKIGVRESFPLAVESRVAMGLERSAGAPIVRLEIEPGPPSAGQMTRRPIVVEALLGSELGEGRPGEESK